MNEIMHYFDTLPKPFIFVLMPFDPKFDDIYKFGIKGACDDVGAYAERLDEQIFIEGMLDRIFNQISKADVIVADMTGRNPNVFYEVGYAHANGKIVLLVTQNSDDIPFDLKHRQHTVYSGKIDLLRQELVPKLQWAIGEAQKRSNVALPGHWSVRLNEIELNEGVRDASLPLITGTIDQRSFSLPLKIRNESTASATLRRTYLFNTLGNAVFPAEYKRLISPIHLQQEEKETSLGWVEAESFSANPVDAMDGLVRQYRIPFNFLDLPPGDTEMFSIQMSLAEDVKQCDSVLRLRLHTPQRYYDYKFRLKLQLLVTEDVKSSIVDRLITVEECESLANNVQNSNPALATEARRRAVELRAAAHGAKTAAEQEALRSVYAYEEGLSKKRGRRIRASRTWQMIDRHGIIGAVERAVNRKKETTGYMVLREMGMGDFAFEVVVVRYPHLFSPEAVTRSQGRIDKWRDAEQGAALANADKPRL
jgi:hypothetical protein